MKPRKTLVANILVVALYIAVGIACNVDHRESLS